MFQRVSSYSLLDVDEADKQAMDDWDRIIPMLQRIKVDV
jgi:hypothetical protein